MDVFINAFFDFTVPYTEPIYRKAMWYGTNGKTYNSTMPGCGP